MEVGFDHLSTCREELATTVDGRNPASQFIWGFPKMVVPPNHPF